jgi:hypothetical protein
MKEWLKQFSFCCDDPRDVELLVRAIRKAHLLTDAEAGRVREALKDRPWCCDNAADRGRIARAVSAVV